MAKYKKDKSKSVKSRSERPLRTEVRNDVRGGDEPRDDSVGPLGIGDLLLEPIGETRGNTGRPDTGGPGNTGAPTGGGEPMVDISIGADIGASEQGYIDAVNKYDHDGHDHHDQDDMTNVQDHASNMIFNTLSCPCSTKAIELDNGVIACEKNNFGEVTVINAIPVHNHLIAGLKPKIRDKWRCIDVRCSEGEFKWESLYIVSVVESIDNNINTSILNSKISTSNCYIPRSSVVDSNDYIVSNGLNLEKYAQNLISGGVNVPTSGFNIDENIGPDKNNPVFKTKEQAWWFKFSSGVGASLKDLDLRLDAYDYDFNGVKGYTNDPYSSTIKIINKATLNGRNLVFENDQSGIQNNYPHKAYNPIIGSNGGTIKLNLTGRNKPVFSVSIKNSEGRNVLKQQVKDVSSDNYNLQQSIPALPPGKTSEEYTVEIKTSSDTKFDFFGFLNNRVIKSKIYQYARPTFTLSPSAPNLASVDNYATAGSGTASATGEALSHVTSYNRSISYLPWVHTTTITRSSGSKNLYVSKIPKVKDVVTNGNVIKKEVISSEGREVLVIQSSDSSDGSTISNTGDVAVGMKVKGTTTKTKEVIGFIDIDKNEDPCYDFTDEIYTNRFEIINSESDIFAGMSVTGVNANNEIFYSVLASVDSQIGGKSCITLENKQVLDKGAELTFTYRALASVLRVTETSQGALLVLNDVVSFPSKTTLEFTSGNEAYIDGQITHTQTGGNSLVITTTIDEVKFGHEDVTFTLNIEDFVTVTPPARDQKVFVGKDTPRLINFTEGDTSDNAQSMTVNIIRNPSNGTLTSLSKGGSLTYPNLSYYTPSEHFTGEDKIRFTLSDGVETSEEKTIFITIK
tara:strand:- start:14581 stop:17136 length:2556 start_codon:yes stop_codon:yes gene_type:complete